MTNYSHKVHVGKIRVMELSNSKLVLLYKIDLFSLASDKIHKDLTHKESSVWFNTVEVSPQDMESCSKHHL